MSSLVTVELKQLQGVPVLHIAGEMRLDLSTVERELNRLAAGKPPVVVIDCADLIIISSLGLGMLNTFRRGLHTHGGVTRLAALQPNVLKSLQLCSLDRLFEIYESVDAAVVGAVATQG